MDTTETLVRALKARTGIDSDYGIAKHLGITRAAVSAYATGRHTLGEDVAIRVATDLGLDPGYVLACMAAERAKRPPAKKAWERVARRMAQAAIVLMVLGVTGALPEGAAALQAIDFSTVRYTHYATHPAAWLFAVGLLLKALRDSP